MGNDRKGKKERRGEKGVGKEKSAEEKRGLDKQEILYKKRKERKRVEGK